MLQSFKCPNCQGTLDFDAKTKSPTVHCPYCGSTVIVPPTLGEQRDDAPITYGTEDADAMASIMKLVQNGRKIEAIKLFRNTFHVGLKEAKSVIETMAQIETIHLSSSSFHVQSVPFPAKENGQTSKGTGCRLASVLIIVAILALAIGGFLLFTTTSSQTGEEVQTFAESVRETAVTEHIEATATPAFADVVLQFGGEEGIGPGFFNDTRQIAVDGEGNIYTGDYSGGRIQVFDSNGKFLTSWNAGEALYMRGMTVDRNGIVYILNVYDIEMYRGMTGEFLGVVPISGSRTTFDTAAIGSDGSLYFAGRERLVRLDNQGNVVLDISDPFANLSDFQNLLDDIAVDGKGDILVLGRNTIYRLNAKGEFIDRFGSEGDAEDQFFGSADTLAVDGQGRIYVYDFDGIKVFDSNGRYLDIIDSPGIAFDMLVTVENDLLLMDRNGNEVRKYRFNR